jgi:beta-galactosidase beta subunit
MIFDKLSNAFIYYGTGERVARAFKWLASNDLGSLPEGRLEIEGDNIFVNISTAETNLL